MATATEQVQALSNSKLLRCLDDAESRPRTTWARSVLPLLRPEVKRRGLDPALGARLRRLEKAANDAYQRGMTAYETLGVNGAGPGGAIAVAVTQSERLWAEFHTLEASIDNPEGSA